MIRRKQTRIQTSYPRPHPAQRGREQTPERRREADILQH